MHSENRNPESDYNSPQHGKTYRCDELNDGDGGEVKRKVYGLEVYVVDWRVGYETRTSSIE